MSDEHCRSESTVGDDGTKIRVEVCESAWCTCDTIAEVPTVGHLQRHRTYVFQIYTCLWVVLHFYSIQGTLSISHHSWGQDHFSKHCLYLNFFFFQIQTCLSCAVLLFNPRDLVNFWDPDCQKWPEIVDGHSCIHWWGEFARLIII